MSNKKMSDAELHFLGIKAVYKHLTDKGDKVLNVRNEMDINPQILAEIDGARAIVVVKTSRYPHMGIITPPLAAQMQTLANKMKCRLYFASVGIANALGETDEAMAQPETNGEYYINFKGLTFIPV
jgi:hypothetical protein